MFKAVVALFVMGAIGVTVAAGLNKNCVMPPQMCEMFPGCEVRNPCECYLPDGCWECAAPNYCEKRVKK